MFIGFWKFRVHGFEPFPGTKIFRNMLFLNCRFSGSHITSEMKTQETILNAVRADAPKGVHSGEGMWTFSTSIVSSLGECILASELVKSTCGSCSWSHKATSTSQTDSAHSFLTESNPGTGGRWGAGCLPKKKCLRKRHGESGL